MLRARFPSRFLTALFLAILALRGRAALDSDADGLDDIWQLKFGAAALRPEADDDGDGLTNAQESLLGTDPRDRDSRLALRLSPAGAALRLSWHGRLGKLYQLQTASDPTGPWIAAAALDGLDADIDTSVPLDAAPRLFARVQATDVDSDGDGLSDWDELTLGFDPLRPYSEGLGSKSTSSPVTDLQKARAVLAAPAATLTIAAIDPAMEEHWPDPGVVVIRRAGWQGPSEVSRLDRLSVNLSLSGTATRGADYTSSVTTSVVFPLGRDEVCLDFTPLVDDLAEDPETITVTLEPGYGYQLADRTSATLTIADSSADHPGPKEAARFLEQATFGPSPRELARVQSLGFENWIDAQLARPVGLHLPLLQQWSAELVAAGKNPYPSSEYRMEVWWRRAMADGGDSDPLRQRVALALSEIFVVSDRMASVDAEQLGLTSYYDLMVAHAFGNFRDLLEGVARHPVMGIYLSSLQNCKADPSLNRFPDENFAREVMQLFTIGLVRLHPDGTPILSDGTDPGPDGVAVPAGQPIPTYDVDQIATMARIFTGLSYSMRTTLHRAGTMVATTRFVDDNDVTWMPMRMFDAEHDPDAKTLWFPGCEPLRLPARAPSLLDPGAGGDADLTAALDYLFNHPNVGPFIARRLIQRLVTSNPTSGYIGRVAAVFADDGQGVRGDLGAVVRAILLDPEARDFSATLEPTHGMIREPYVRVVALARALEAAPTSPSAGGRYRGFAGLNDEILQRPLSAPSVFNFFQPDYQPVGELHDAGLFSPEMQITNSVSSIAGPNRLAAILNPNGASSFHGFDAFDGLTCFNRTTVSDDPATPLVDERTWNTRANEAAWLDLAAGDPDVLIAAIDRLLCAGAMTPPTFRAIARALHRLADPATAGDSLTRDRRALERFRVAVLLASLSPDSAVLK